jgi:ABC-2 type transport system permease protein
MIDADPSLPDGEKGIQKELNAIRRDVGAYDANLETLLMTLANQKKSLLYGLDYTGGSVVPLTADARAKMIDSVAVTVYKIEHRIESDPYTSDPSEVAFMMMNYVGFFLVILLMMILAGGSFSSEISTGSIKSLIVAPVKRWKIYFAKFASILTVGVLASLLLYAVSVLAHGLFFGFGSGAGYVYATNGVARELSFPIYRLAYLAAELAPLLVYMTFAFMMSIVTRNTAASVAISIGVYFASSVSESFLKAFGSGEWLKFLPFNNFNLASRLFPDSLNGQISTYVAAGFPKITVAFSLAYLGVLFLLMLYTGLDSFNRRDIK